MATTRRLTCFDLLKFNNVNLDELTETYHQPFYLEYLAKWPEYFAVQEAPDKEIMGYVMGKVEGKGKDWHGVELIQDLSLCLLLLKLSPCLFLAF